MFEQHEVYKMRVQVLKCVLKVYFSHILAKLTTLCSRDLQSLDIIFGTFRFRIEKTFKPQVNESRFSWV